MMRSILNATLGFVVAAVAAPAWANPNPAGQMGPAQPGTLNYVEGQATLDGRPVDHNAIGSVQLQPGQMLATQNGRAEILLTPGVFVRLDSNGSVQMVSPDLANTEVRLGRGRALVEVDWIQKDNRLVVDVGPRQIALQEKGLYDFDADKGLVRVFDGRAAVLEPNREVHIQGGHEVMLTAAKLKAEGFDKTAYEDDLYRWSQLRASYLGEANIQMARSYYGEAGPYGYAGYYPPYPWYGAGWYWDPWFTAYTWLPGDGLFWSPFGFGFYSPLLAYRAPFVGGLYGYHAFGPGFHPAIGAARVQYHGNSYVNSAARSQAIARGNGGFSGASRGGFAGGGGFRGGGGFGGGGGFHGGRR